MLNRKRTEKAAATLSKASRESIHFRSSLGKVSKRRLSQEKLSCSLSQDSDRRDWYGLTQRAVAIPALGWRLRVEPRLTCCFENTVRLAAP